MTTATKYQMAPRNSKKNVRSTTPCVGKAMTRGKCKAHSPGKTLDANKRVRNSDREDETDVAIPRDKNVKAIVTKYAETPRPTGR